MIDRIVDIHKNKDTVNNASPHRHSIEADKKRHTKYKLPLKLDSLNNNVRQEEAFRISNANAYNKKRLNAIKPVISLHN